MGAIENQTFLEYVKMSKTGGQWSPSPAARSVL